MKKEIYQSDLDCLNLITIIVPLLRSLGLVEGDIKGFNLSDKFPNFRDIEGRRGIVKNRIAVEVIGVELKGSSLIKNEVGRYLVALVEIYNFGLIRGSGKITLMISGFEVIDFEWDFFNSDPSVLNLRYRGPNEISGYPKALLEKVREMHPPKIEAQTV